MYNQLTIQNLGEKMKIEKAQKLIHFRGKQAEQVAGLIQGLRADLEKVQNVIPSSRLTNADVAATALALARMVFRPDMRLIYVRSFSKMANTMIAAIEKSIMTQIKERVDLSGMREEVEQMIAAAVHESSEVRPVVESRTGHTH